MLSDQTTFHLIHVTPPPLSPFSVKDELQMFSETHLRLCFSFMESPGSVNTISTNRTLRLVFCFVFFHFKRQTKGRLGKIWLFIAVSAADRNDPERQFGTRSNLEKVRIGILRFAGCQDLVEFCILCVFNDHRSKF